MVRADLDAVLDLWVQLNDAGTRADARYAIRPDGLRLFRQRVQEDWLGRFLPFPACQVAELDGALIGYVQGDIVRPHPILEEPPKARIGNLWVAPAHRRQGIARALVDTWVATAHHAGFPWIEVGTLGQDTRAVAFWRALGFGDWRVSLLREEPTA